MPKGKPFYKEYGELLDRTIIPTNESYRDNIKPLNDIIKQNLPSKLFRFRVCNENTIDAFRKNRIFFNTPNNFNDPHDCLVYIDYDKIKQEIESINTDYVIQLAKNAINTGELPPIIKGIFSEDVQKEMRLILENSPDIIRQNLVDLPANINELIFYAKEDAHDTCSIVLSHIKRTSKLACFSQQIKAPLMWSYYADSHKGFALEYDLTNFVLRCDNCPNKCSDPALHYDLYPIVYTDKRYDATALAHYFVMKKLIEGLNLNGIKPLSIPDRLAFQKANTYKATCWKHEKEWRMELYCNPDSNRIWCECKPKSIYFGCNIADIHRDILLRYAKENKIPAFQMDIQLMKMKYRMNFTKI